MFCARKIYNQKFIKPIRNTYNIVEMSKIDNEVE